LDLGDPSDRKWDVELSPELPMALARTVPDEEVSMPTKMDIAKSTSIVQFTLKSRLGQSRDLSLDTRLGEFLLTHNDRTWFQQEIAIRVKKEGFRIKRSLVPIEPHLTIREIAHSLVGSALPGDPQVPDEN